MILCVKNEFMGEKWIYGETGNENGIFPWVSLLSALVDESFEWDTEEFRDW